MIDLWEPVGFERELLRKYDVPGPRYTSYPTAPHFRDDFGPRAYEALLRESARSHRPLSLYVHIPFCSSLCFYCGCNVTISHNRAKGRAYLALLEREMGAVARLAGAASWSGTWPWPSMRTWHQGRRRRQGGGALLPDGLRAVSCPRAAGAPPALLGHGRIDAMEHLLVYLRALGELAGELWLYMLVGFLVAAVVEEFVPEERLLRYFGSNDPLSLLRGAATGFMVSACSCGAIPLVATLRRRGASTATSLTFLLASPWLGVPMLLIYVSFLGWARTGALLVLSLTVAFTAGLIMAALERRGRLAQGARYAERWEMDPEVAIEGGCGCDPPCEEGSHRRSLRRRLFLHVPRLAWNLGKDIGPYLLFGMVLAALAKAFVPADMVARYLGQGAGPLALLVALPISVGIEACSEGFAVVAGQLFHMGATLAVVFLITMVGVATDFTELSVLWGKFGRRTTLIYLGIGTSLTLVVALGLQVVL